MDEESCNWFRFAKLLVDVGGEILQELFSVYFQTSSFMQYLAFWHERIWNPGQINYLSNMYSSFHLQLSGMDASSQRFFGTMIKSWKPDRFVKTISQQIIELEKWDLEIKDKLSSSPSDLHGILSAWSKDVQLEVCRLRSLFQTLHKWNDDFQRHTNDTQLILLDLIKKYQDNLLTSFKHSLVDLKNPTFQDLQSLFNMLPINIQQASQTWQQECADFLSSWEQKLNSLLNSWQQAQVQNTTSQQVLQSLLNEYFHELPRLRGTCQYQLQNFFASWHQDLHGLITRWLQELGRSPGTSDNEFQNCVDIWVQDCNNHPNYKIQRLKDFLCSMQCTLRALKSKKILTEPQFSILYSTQGSPNLEEFDITLLTVLLRNVCSVCPPEMGWHVNDPSDDDICTGTDILRLKSCRNKFVAHIHPAKLHGAVFDDFWEKAEGFLFRLASRCGSSFETEIRQKVNTLKAGPIDPQQEERYKLQLSMWRKSDLVDEMSEMSSKNQATEEKITHCISMVETLQDAVQNLQCGFTQFTDTQKSALDTVHYDLPNIQKLLIKSYQDLKTVQINPVFADTVGSIEEFYTDLVIKEDNEEIPGDIRREVLTKKLPIHSFRQLFNKGNMRVNRIVLKAAAGLGKSTFCRKLVQIWCLFQNSRLNNLTEMIKPSSQTSLNEMEDGDVMLMFDILLYINLGAITNEKDFVDLIYTQIPILKSTPKLSKNNLLNMMEEVVDNKILLILDGLDEMDVSASYIEQILKRKLYPTMTVLVSSRTWKIGQLQLTQPVHIDLLVDVQGFNYEKSMLFATKILEHYGEKSAIKQFRNDVKNSSVIENIVHVPLLVLFLVHVWYKKKSFPDSVFLLYLEMLDVMVDRYKEKRDNIGTADVPFNLHVEESHLLLKEFPNLEELSITNSFGEEFLLVLCDIASHFLFGEKQENSLVFEEKVLLKLLGKDGKSKLQVALDIGLLSKQYYTAPGEFTRKVSLSFPHKTIQELLAAIYLCCSESKFSQFLNQLKTYDDVLQSEIIIMFIAGVSSQKCEAIFENIFEACDDQNVYENLHKTPFLWYSLPTSLCKLYRNCVRETSGECTHFRLKHMHVGSLQEFNTIFSSIKSVTDLRSLILENINFTSFRCKAQLDVSKCDNLKYLALRNIQLDHVNLNLPVCPGLLGIWLVDVTMSNESAVQLSNSLSQCTQIQQLTLKNVDCVDGKLDISGASGLPTRALYKGSMPSISLPQCTQLQHLRLEKVNLGEGSLDISRAYRLSVLSLNNVTMSSISLLQCVQLHMLVLLNVDLADGILDISGASCLSELSLHNVNMSSIRLSQCTQLQTLRLENVVTLGDNKLDFSGASPLSKLWLDNVTLTSMSLSQCPQVQKLTMKSVNLGNGKLDLSGASCLSKLKLHNVTMSIIGISQCTQLHKLQLENVNLDNGNLDLSGALCLSKLRLNKVTISSISLSHCTQVQTLQLDNVNLVDGKLDLSGTSCLSKIWLDNITISSISLSECTQLHELKIVNVNISNGELDLSGAFCLYKLRVNNVILSNEGAVLLCNSLSQCTQLQELRLEKVNLGNCTLSLSEVSSLSELCMKNVAISSIGLLQCTQLHRLILENVNLGDGKLDISRASCLSELTLYKVTLSNESSAQLCNSLSLDDSQLKRLNLEDVDLGDALLNINNLPPNIDLDMHNVTVSSECADLLQASLCVRGIEIVFIDLTSPERGRFTCFCHAKADSDFSYEL